MESLFLWKGGEEDPKSSPIESIKGLLGANHYTSNWMTKDKREGKP
jgi:hypothetical protein